MIETVVQFILQTVEGWGYTGIFIMMVIESSFFPFPSEVAMIPAGYLSSTGEMLFPIALIAGTAGALIGATINYFLAFKLGEPIINKLINKYGKYIFVNENHYKQSEIYFQRHGAITTFIARFIPAIRQLISLPAGAFKMNYAKFFFYTGLGAGLWNLALMAIGYVAGENKELIAEYSKEVTFVIVALLIVILSIYIYIHKRKKRHAKK